MAGQRSLVVACLVVALTVMVMGNVGSGAATATQLLTRANGGIAFGEGGRLVVVNPNSLGVRTVALCPAGSGGCGIFESAWSPSGRRLAFVEGSLAVNHPSHMSLYVVAAEGGKARRLASCGSCGWQYGGRLGWSPNGRRIAFTRETGLWIVSAKGGRLHRRPHRLTTCSRESCVDIDPAWSPDRRLLVFEHITRTGEQLYTIRPDGSNLTKIAQGGEPQWSPDGSRIAFDSTPDSIAVANADGSHVHVLLAGARGSGPGFPSWSPDGSKLVFRYTPGSPGQFTAEVWTINADGSDKTRLYHSGCCVGLYAPQSGPPMAGGLPSPPTRPAAPS